MQRKLLFSLISFLIFFSFFNFIFSVNYNQAYAKEVTCNAQVGNVIVDYDYTPAQLTTESENLRITINTRGHFPEGPYLVRLVNGGSVIPGGFTGNISEANPTLTGTVNSSDIGGFKQGEFRVILYEGDRVYATSIPLCLDIFTVTNPSDPNPPGDPSDPSNPGASSCTIVKDGPLNPSKGLQFKVNGLQNVGSGRGLVIRNMRTNAETNTCKTNEELRNGLTFKSIGGTLATADSYHVEIGEKCHFTGTNDGPMICEEILNIAVGGGSAGCINDSVCKNDGEVCLPAEGDEPRKCGILDPFEAGKVNLSCKEMGPDGNRYFECNTALGKIRTDPNRFIQDVLRLILAVAGAILLLLIIINGYKFMASQGDPDKIKDAREGIIAAIAGILLIIFSLAILRLITYDILGIPGFT